MRQFPLSLPVSVRAIVASCALAVLAACGGDRIYASSAEVASARFVAGPPTYLTLYTGINDRNGAGAHSALLVNASERVLFDPAGTWSAPGAPERGDVHFGMTDRMVNFYLDYQARDSETEKYHVIEHTIPVSPEVAQEVYRRVLAYGSVPKAHCALAVSTVLRDVEGFESLPSTWFPKRLGKAFGDLPGVSTRIVTEENDNPDDSHGFILVDARGHRVN